MMGKTHLIAGLAAGVASIVVNDMPYPAIVLAGVAVGSLAPDIDHPKSIISRKLRPVRWLASLFKHRGFFHSFIGWFAVVLAMTVLVSPVTSINSDISVMVGIFIGAFAYGYILHIAMDAMTTQGV
jgi:inner membrane protein